MKTLCFALLLATSVGLPNVYAQKGTLVFPKPPNTNPPPKDYIVEPAPPPLSTLKDQPAHGSASGQKPAPGQSALYTAAQAQAIISGFKQAYPKLGSPRFLIHVNHGESSAAPSASKKDAPAGNTSRPAVTDAQLAADVERLFSRPLREAGASLADQTAADQLIGDKPLDDFVSMSDQPEARKNRQALQKIADVVIEISMFSSARTAPAASASPPASVPDLQATAISLKDSRILGQAASADLTSRLAPAAAGSIDLREIAEATALALMEDMTPKP